MDAILNDLKQQLIISPEDIKALQHTLLSQHPDLSNNERAQLFAKAIHQTLNETLHPFKCHSLNSLKHSLLQQTLLKENFSINALDIFNVYIQTESLDAHHLASLTTWLNHYSPRELSVDEVGSLATAFSSVLESSATSYALPLAALDINDSLTISALLRQNKWLLVISSLLVIMTSLLSYQQIGTSELKQQTIVPGVASSYISLPISLGLRASTTHLQDHLQYKTVDTDALKIWLNERHSLLATEPYFSTLLETAKSFNINPLLLFAITGQEQNFVPSTHPYATQIANNPFNLYGSWKDYNTSIEEAAQIAARTIIRLGKSCPKEEDPIQWINKAYAEDPDWHIGVSYFLNELESATAFTN